MVRWLGLGCPMVNHTAHGIVSYRTLHVVMMCTIQGMLIVYYYSMPLIQVEACTDVIKEFLLCFFTSTMRKLSF